MPSALLRGASRRSPTLSRHTPRHFWVALAGLAHQLGFDYRGIDGPIGFVMIEGWDSTYWRQDTKSPLVVYVDDFEVSLS